ncbi:hypothetical protein SLEP1_g2301 [Rubroshorea leprosula]|uniref:Uncharacterized protein n=1 Tax=Rubroshorea leprosula TaxID=152421 RepID=A0AAV5HR71_9ROSI|nr:hypothetical protein SLEP1_g2301 [Rubroshorea leprosula]
MAEPGSNAEGEIELVLGDESMRIGDCGDSLRSNASFLSELNLLVVFLSMFALSDEECMDFDGEEKKSAGEHEAKAASVTKLQPKRREINDGKPLGRRRSQRFQTTPKDFRHCRRM